MVKALLHLYDEEKSYDRDREHYKNLHHPEIATQLHPYIIDKRKGVIVRRTAIDIAESCNIQSLNGDLSTVVLDHSDTLAIRVQAAYAIGRIGDDATRERIKSLLTGEMPDDRQDELKGSILRALWPSHISAAELFPLLTPPKSEGFVGAYRVFLSSELAQSITAENLIPALQFASELRQPRYKMDLSLESLMDGIVTKAWENLDEPGVTEALAKFVVSRLKHHDEIIRGKLDKADQFVFQQNEDKRRRLLKAVLFAVAEHPETEGSWLLYSHTAIVLSNDFHWLISLLDQNVNTGIQHVLADILFRLFDNRCPNHLDAIYEAGKTHPLVADKFKCVWEPVILGSVQAQQLKARHEEDEAWRRRRDKPPLNPPPAERLASALKECEDHKLSAWWRVTRELTLEATSTGYDGNIEWDVMKLPGWLSADEVTRQRIVQAAENYVRLDTPPSPNWVGTRQWSLSVMSQWSAVALVQKVSPIVMQNLPPDQMVKWCPIIVAFPFLDNDNDRSVKEALLKLAYRKSPLAVLDTAKILIDREIENDGTISTATELNAVWDEQIATLLLEYAKRSDLKPQSLRSLLSILLSHDNVETYSLASSLVPTPPPAKEPERSLAIAATTTLMLNTRDAGWSIVWPAIEADEDFGKQVIQAINHDYATIGLRLTEHQLADLYIWLTRHFESPKHSVGIAHRVGIPESVDFWRNAIIQLLTHRGSIRASEAIKRIQRELPELDWLKWVLLDAQAQTRRATWVHPQPQQIIKLAADRELRLIQSGDQLLQVLLESLERIQSLLHGETPEVPFLWNNASKTTTRPKDENAFANYVKIQLDKDLKQRGIVLNREVQIHRGERTDIHVTAISQAASGDAYDSVTVIIECKGCWNTELKNAMRDQLVSRYLKDNHCQHGLYLVGWFNCDTWSKQDSRRKRAEKLCPRIDSTRQLLATSAADLSKGSTRVKSVVLDASLH
ncbi:MAG: hypothetical protein AB7L09_09980 [Nitrospira sp.]